LNYKAGILPCQENITIDHRKILTADSTSIFTTSLESWPKNHGNFSLLEAEPYP